MHLKIMNSLITVKQLNLSDEIFEEKMINYANTIKFMDLSNNEAHAAKLYFKYIFTERFRRNDEDNVINKMLNYGYAVLLSYVVRALVAKGFDARLGLFHKSYNNNFALGTDIMEPLRCIIDMFVYQYINNHELIDFGEYKKGLFEHFYNNVKVKNQTLSIVLYIDRIIETLLINNGELEKVYID
ncbi:UNVERIFIED_CONTAM: type II CRISPR-associated endonuclease Cas1 [Campylobacter lari]